MAQRATPTVKGSDVKAPTLADKPTAVRLKAGACYRYVLSSGLFGLPANAKSVDWMIINNASTAQTFRVTVFKAGIGPKSAVAPGTLTITLPANETTHNANSVGLGKPFVPGFYYEVVVETDDPAVLPSVHVWQDLVNTVIPGTLISPGTFVRI